VAYNYTYRCSSVVCLLVGLFVTIVSYAKTDEPIEMPFEVLSQVGPGNHVLDGLHLANTTEPRGGDVALC